MHLSLALIFALLAPSVTTKQCQTFSVPVTVCARNGIFNVPTLQDNHDATTFFANFTNPAGNFSNEVLLGYRTINSTYNISVKFCRPDAGYGPTVQFLTHGIGFDKRYINSNFAKFKFVLPVPSHLKIECGLDGADVQDIVIGILIIIIIPSIAILMLLLINMGFRHSPLIVSALETLPSRTLLASYKRRQNYQLSTN